MKVLTVIILAFAFSITGKATTAPWDDTAMSISGSAPLFTTVPDDTNDSDLDGKGFTLIIAGPGYLDPSDLPTHIIDITPLIPLQPEPVLSYGDDPLPGSIPEPTNGLLLLVGAAFLLLNRRQSTTAGKKP